MIVHLKSMIMDVSKLKWSVSCENKYHIYKNWTVEASNELEAWAEFLKKKGGTSKGFKNIKIVLAQKTNK